MENQKEMDPFSNLARKGALNENLRAQQKLDEDNAKVKTAKYHDLYKEFQFMLNPDDDSEMEDEEIVEGDGENLKQILQERKNRNKEKIAIMPDSLNLLKK